MQILLQQAFRKMSYPKNFKKKENQKIITWISTWKQSKQFKRQENELISSNATKSKIDKQVN